MKVSVKILGLTKAEVHLEGGTVVFFSYRTPVAAVHDGVYYETTKSYSRTTAKHVSQWRPPKYKKIKPVSEDFLATLLSSAIMEEDTKDVVEALKVLRAALVPHMGQLPDVLMNKIVEALGLLVVDTEEEQ